MDSNQNKCDQVRVLLCHTFSTGIALAKAYSLFVLKFNLPCFEGASLDDPFVYRSMCFIGVGCWKKSLILSRIEDTFLHLRC